MLIITGNGRSGTSAIAAFCHKIGFKNAGEDYIDESIRGGAEHIAVTSLIDKFNNKETIDGEIAELKGFDVIKSPQFVNQGSELLWAEMKKRFDNLNVLLVHRDWLDTARSFAKYNMHEYGGLYVYEEKEIHLLADRLKSHFVDAIRSLLSLRIHYQIISFPDYLFDFESTASVLNCLDLCFDRNNAKVIWDQYMLKDSYTRKSV